MSTDDRRARAARLHDEGLELSDAGDEDAALARYLAALELDLARPNTHYNIGLIYKYRGAWEESLRYNRRAHELDPGDEAAAWNLAIAATALRDWKTARAAWQSRGIRIPEGEGPIEGDFGGTPVRLNPDGDAEVVWARRLCPVRARLTNIPYAESGFRYGDVVLHDGAPVGYRMSEGHEYGVFNVLQLFTPSRFSTYEAEIVAPTPEDRDALEQRCERASLAFEDWTASVRILCRACSEGRPHASGEEHGEGGPGTPTEDVSWAEERRIAIAATSDALVHDILEAWADDRRRVAGWSRTADGAAS